LLVVDIRFLTQRPIVDVAYTAERASQHLLLLVCRVTSLPVRSVLFHTLHSITYDVECQPFAPFICRLEGDVGQLNTYII
jgi:hypothetical protein